MSRTVRSLLQMVLALVLALTAGLLVFRWLSARAPAAPVAQVTVRTVQVVVAATDMPKGARIESGMLRLAPFVEGSEPSQSFREQEPLVGRVLAQSVGKGEAVTAPRLAPEDVKVGGISAMLGPGRRAMAVKGNKVMGLAGFIRPGNLVDVLVTLPVGEREEKVTKLVLEKVPVLATGTELEPSGDGEKPSSVDVYTLDLTPEESEKLALAATQGTLNFALRNEADQETVLTNGADTAATLASLRPVQVRPKAAAQAAPRPAVEGEVIRGGTRDRVRF